MDAFFFDDVIGGWWWFSRLRSRPSRIATHFIAPHATHHIVSSPPQTKKNTKKKHSTLYTVLPKSARPMWVWCSQNGLIDFFSSCFGLSGLVRFFVGFIEVVVSRVFLPAFTRLSFLASVLFCAAPLFFQVFFAVVAIVFRSGLGFCFELYLLVVAMCMPRRIYRAFYYNSSLLSKSINTSNFRQERDIHGQISVWHYDGRTGSECATPGVQVPVCTRSILGPASRIGESED